MKGISNGKERKQNLRYLTNISNSELDIIKESGEENISDDSFTDEVIPTTNFDFSDILKFTKDNEKALAGHKEINIAYNEMNFPNLHLSDITLDTATPQVECVETPKKIIKEINLPNNSNGCKPGMNEKVDNVMDSIIEINKDMHNLNFHKDVEIVISNSKKIAQLSEGITSEVKIKDRKEGYLLKQHGNYMIAWNRRYCKIEHSEFLFFKDTEVKLLSGIINFKRLPVKIKHDDMVER